MAYLINQKKEKRKGRWEGEGSSRQVGKEAVGSLVASQWVPVTDYFPSCFSFHVCHLRDIFLFRVMLQL